jgi:hypothetical protein
MEDLHYRFINVFVYPLELKGLGQLNINCDDDVENYDQGFAYLPAFKRTIRMSATTFQDNVGGSDMTYGDPEGLREPFGTWNFKLIEKKYVLIASPDSGRRPTMAPDGITVNPNLDWVVGEKYPRLGWTINPVYIVEATPKDTGHMYSKKILYVEDPYFSSAQTEEMALSDLYDRSGQLWKSWYDLRGLPYTHADGEIYAASAGQTMHDLQTGHTTHFLHYLDYIDGGMEPESICLKKLLQLGR